MTRLFNLSLSQGAHRFIEGKAFVGLISLRADLVGLIDSVRDLRTRIILRLVINILNEWGERTIRAVGAPIESHILCNQYIVSIALIVR